MPTYDNKHIVELSVFDAGLHSKAQPLHLLPEQSPDLKNVVFDDYGAIGIRSGIKTHNSTIISATGDGIYGAMGLVSYKPSTMTAQLIGFFGAGTWVLTDTATAAVSVPSSTGVWPVSQYVETAVFHELLFMVSKDYQPYKFNGNEFTKMGVSAPTWTGGALSSNSGNLTGEYNYVFWGVNSYGAEGDYGDSFAVVTFASGRASVSNIATAPISAGINYWKVGRNTAGAAGVYWYLTDVTNGTTSFTDNVADSSLTELAPVDQGYPRQFSMITAYGGRVWGAYQDYLWYSNQNQPEEFPSENFIRVGRGDGMEISAITPFMGMIVISKSDYAGRIALYTLTIGDSATFADPESWYLKLVSQNSGSETHRGVVPMGNYLILPNRYGIHLFDGVGVSQAVTESTQGGIVSESIANAVADRFSNGGIAGLAPAKLKNAAAINYQGRIYFAHPRDTDQEIRNTNTLVYDYSRTGGKGIRNGAWSEFPSVGASQFAIHKGKLFGGAPKSGSPVDESMEGGYIHEWDNGTNAPNGLDFGSRIDAYFVTAPIHGSKGHEGYTKDFRWVIFNEKGSSPNITITFYVDGTSLSTATLIHTETYTLSSSGRDFKVNLPSVASGKRLWIKYAWSGPNSTTITEADAPKLMRVKVFYSIRGLRNA